MAIEKVIIQNFKKFKNPFEVKFNENINLLVGDNESGKSTILEAIHVALTGMYAGRNIRNQLSTYLFNREAVEEYLASVKNEQPIAPPEIMIELYFKSGTLPEYEGNGNSEKSDGIEGIRFTISFSDKFNSEYESLLKTEKITSLPIEFYEAKWFSFSRDEKMPRFIPIKSVMIDSSNYRYQNGSDVYISRVVKDFLEPEDITAITQAHPRQTTYRTHYEAKYKKYAGGKIVIFVQDNIAGMNIDTTTLSTSYRNNQIICDLANQMYPDMKPCDSAMNEKTGHDGIFWVHENDIDKYVDIYNPVQLWYDKRTKVNPIPKTMNFGLSKGLTFNRVLIYPTKPMLDWLSGKSKDMKDESLSKFYVAVTRARYSVAFVYKTKRLPTNDIGTKWTPDVL